MQWLRGAKYGLFLHYGLYSMLGRSEWVQFKENIRVAEYAALMDFFNASDFDAGAIADLAVEARMKYITITTRHHDCFCLWDTRQTTFRSTLAPCGRDLVAELAEACADRGLGLCLYYSHGRDWKHPHAPNNDQYGGGARPTYDPPELTYATGDAHNLQIYLDFMSAQITELLTNYGPIAAIWLDGIGVPNNGDADAFRCQELYDLIHSLQPQVLLSYKKGLTGTEDFYSPELGWDYASLTGSEKPWEVCGCLSGGWGYTAGTEHKSPNQMWELLEEIVGNGGNLLLNTGPLPEGGIEPVDAETLRAVGQRIDKEGFSTGK